MLTILFNSLMMKCLVQSMREIGSSLTTILNFVFNHFLSVISSQNDFYFSKTGIGCFILGETINKTWAFGASLIIAGIVILVSEKEEGKLKS